MHDDIESQWVIKPSTTRSCINPPMFYGDLMLGRYIWSAKPTTYSESISWEYIGNVQNIQHDMGAPNVGEPELRRFAIGW